MYKIRRVIVIALTALMFVAGGCAASSDENPAGEDNAPTTIIQPPAGDYEEINIGDSCHDILKKYAHTGVSEDDAQNGTFSWTDRNNITVSVTCENGSVIAKSRMMH